MDNGSFNLNEINPELQMKIAMLKEVYAKSKEMKIYKNKFYSTRNQYNTFKSMPLLNKLILTTKGKSIQTKLLESATILTEITDRMTDLLDAIGDLDLFEKEVLTLDDDIATEIINQIRMATDKY